MTHWVTTRKLRLINTDQEEMFTVRGNLLLLPGRRMILICFVWKEQFWWRYTSVDRKLVNHHCIGWRDSRVAQWCGRNFKSQLLLCLIYSYFEDSWKQIIKSCQYFELHWMHIFVRSRQQWKSLVSNASRKVSSTYCVNLSKKSQVHTVPTYAPKEFQSQMSWEEVGAGIAS